MLPVLPQHRPAPHLQVHSANLTSEMSEVAHQPCLPSPMPLEILEMDGENHFQMDPRWSKDLQQRKSGRTALHLELHPSTCRIPITPRGHHVNRGLAGDHHSWPPQRRRSPIRCCHWSRPAAGHHRSPVRYPRCSNTNHEDKHDTTAKVFEKEQQWFTCPYWNDIINQVFQTNTSNIFPDNMNISHNLPTNPEELLNFHQLPLPPRTGSMGKVPLPVHCTEST